MEKETNSNFKYVNRGAEKVIGIFEPNLGIIKSAIGPVLICENAYRMVNTDSTIKHVYITNMGANNERVNSKKMSELITNFKLVKHNKISIENRYVTLWFMAKHADIAVSHQMENPLNYLYFDLAWMGWAIIHNASLCSDIGYYYEGFNFEMGADVLLNVINNHDATADEYLNKNRALIDRYLPTNVELQNKYKILIDKLFSHDCI
jgi:hypothetical protein